MGGRRRKREAMICSLSCALVVAAAAGVAAPAGGNTYTRDADHVGSDGGVCICPDGRRYEVGDNHNNCASLACIGGEAGECRKGGISADNASMKVVCDVSKKALRRLPESPCFEVNIAYVNKDGSLPSSPQGAYVHSATVCQSICQTLAYCKYFTWMRQGKGCYFFEEGAVQKSIDFAESGPRDSSACSSGFTVTTTSAPAADTTDGDPRSWVLGARHKKKKPTDGEGSCSGECCEHSDCQANQYCYDAGFNDKGHWSGEGICSDNVDLCCADKNGDPIDRNASSCPAASKCDEGDATLWFLGADKNGNIPWTNWFAIAMCVALLGLLCLLCIFCRNRGKENRTTRGISIGTEDSDSESFMEGRSFDQSVDQSVDGARLGLEASPLVVVAQASLSRTGSQTSLQAPGSPERQRDPLASYSMLGPGPYPKEPVRGMPPKGTVIRGPGLVATSQQPPDAFTFQSVPPMPGLPPMQPAPEQRSQQPPDAFTFQSVPPMPGMPPMQPAPEQRWQVAPSTQQLRPQQVLVEPIARR